MTNETDKQVRPVVETYRDGDKEYAIMNNKAYVWGGDTWVEDWYHSVGNIRTEFTPDPDNPKVSFCPECGEEIDHVDKAWSTTGSSRVELDPNGDLTEIEKEVDADDVSNVEYSCPKCRNYLTNDENIVLTILKGEWSKRAGDSSE